MSDHRLTSVQAWACSLQLDHPLSFGSFEIKSREYVVVRITTEDGLAAECYGLSRRTPVDAAIVEIVAPAVLGKEALDIDARMMDVDRATLALEGDGTVMRAISLVEIALWDLKAQEARLPLWQLLGGSPRSVPVLLAEGYRLPAEGDDSFADRIAARVAEGYRAIKLEGVSYADPMQVGRRLSAIRERVGWDVEIVLDMAWSWPNLQIAVDHAHQWEDFQLSWIEDPMRRSRPTDIGKLRKAIRTRIGAGDDSTRLAELDALLSHDSVDVLRADATTIGGFGALQRLVSRVRDEQRQLSLHVQPEIHQHATFAWHDIAHVEAFPLDRPFDLTHRLLEETVMDRVRNGMLEPPRNPGMGVRINESAVANSCYREGHASESSRNSFAVSAPSNFQQAND